MDSIIDKVLDSIGIKEKSSQSRRNNRSYDDDRYDVLRKRTSSTASSQSNDDDAHHNIKRHGSTVEKVEDFVSLMFESCATNMKGMFDQSHSPRSSHREGHRGLKGENNFNVGFGGISQRNRGRRSVSRKRRSISRTQRRKPLPENTPLPDNKTMLYVKNDDDEVSALSAGTLEEMASREQRLILLQEAKRKAAAVHNSSYPPNNCNTNLKNDEENRVSIQTARLQNIAEDLKSFLSVSSANTTEFEGIWNEHPLQAVSVPAQSAGIYENRLSISEEVTLDATRKSHVQTLKELDTPLSRKLRRYQVSQAIEEAEKFSLRPDEEEI